MPRQRRGAKRLTPPAWVAFVQLGDVLETPSGAYRVVRDINRDRSGRVCSFDFVKLARSHYPSPTTIRYVYEVRTWRYIGARLKLTTPLDRKIACSITRRRWNTEEHERPPCEIVTQDDVVGVVT